MWRIGTCILADRRPTSVFPRWQGILGCAVALCYVVGAPIAFSWQGPFAWDGLSGSGLQPRPSLARYF
jgi:hypothetical protein